MAKTVKCDNCGQEWPRDPALEVACPKCRAPVGRVCRRPSGHNLWGNQPHRERDQAAMDAGLLQVCTGPEGS
jgi:predicted amidophosphoribosyltransferase